MTYHSPTQSCPLRLVHSGVYTQTHLFSPFSSVLFSDMIPVTIPNTPNETDCKNHPETTPQDLPMTATLVA